MDSSNDSSRYRRRRGATAIKTCATRCASTGSERSKYRSPKTKLVGPSDDPSFAGHGGHQPADLLRVTHPGLLRGR
jgi:hypothetical protein